MNKLLVIAAASFLLLNATPSIAGCDRFVGSTMDVVGISPAAWRTDYPPSASTTSQPWLSFDFQAQPHEYMQTLAEQAHSSFRRNGRRLVGIGSEPWWISLWMDFGSSGREPYMGLTKERGPDQGDLAPASPDGFQVWAVGFYNRAGAVTLGRIFADPCDPEIPQSLSFAEGTVSIKFLFTDAPDISYLAGAPVYDALIDPEGSGSSSPVADRTKRAVRLLQMDIAVKDQRAEDTGWVFGTFAWVGPAKHDQLFDNLVPLSLQWGNDPGIYDSDISQSWINPDLDGIMYGWDSRPFLGFNGRANGPADNLRSSCLSCHAAARIPRSPMGLLGFRFDIVNDLHDPSAVEEHVDTWFVNLPAGDLFDPAAPAVAALDYSLQLDAAVFRMCRACQTQLMSGPTPAICKSAGFFPENSCRGSGMAPLSTQPSLRNVDPRLEMMPPPRQ